MKFHHRAGEQDICKIYGTTRAVEAEFKLHSEQENGKKKPRDLTCPYCDKIFENGDQITKHLIVHTSLKPYRCTKCSYSSYNSDNLFNAHFVSTHGRKGTWHDITIDEVERDKMMEIAKKEAGKMMKKQAPSV